MSANLGLVIPSFIGQTGLETLGPTHVLAALRAPAWIPDALSSLLFDPYWLYYIVLAAVGVVCVWLGKTRNQQNVTRVGFGLVGVAVVWVILGWLFLSPMERLRDRHYAILEAARAHDTKTIKGMLANDFEFGRANRKAMGEAIDMALAFVKVKEAHVRFYEAKATDVPRTALSRINVLTVIEPTGLSPVPEGPYLTMWDLEWTDEPGQDWQIRRIVRARVGNNENAQEIPPDLGFGGAGKP